MPSQGFSLTSIRINQVPYTDGRNSVFKSLNLVEDIPLDKMESTILLWSNQYGTQSRKATDDTTLETFEYVASQPPLILITFPQDGSMGQWLGFMFNETTFAQLNTTSSERKHYVLDFSGGYWNTIDDTMEIPPGGINNIKIYPKGSASPYVFELRANNQGVFVQCKETRFVTFTDQGGIVRDLLLHPFKEAHEWKSVEIAKYLSYKDLVYPSNYPSHGLLPVTVNMSPHQMTINGVVYTDWNDPFPEKIFEYFTSSPSPDDIYMFQNMSAMPQRVSLDSYTFSRTANILDYSRWEAFEDLRIPNSYEMVFNLATKFK